MGRLSATRDQGQVEPAILHHLGMVFVPIVATFSAIAIAVLMFYDIDRSTIRGISSGWKAEISPIQVRA